VLCPAFFLLHSRVGTQSPADMADTMHPARWTKEAFRGLESAVEKGRIKLRTSPKVTLKAVVKTTSSYVFPHRRSKQLIAMRARCSGCGDHVFDSMNP